MLLTIASALLYVQIKEAALRNTLTHTAVELWQDWEIHVLVLFSLCLQFVLACLGNLRKTKNKVSWHIAIIVWSAYMLADWVATVTLSIVSRTEKRQIQGQLVLCWIPFMLLHLGCPDSISAYSLADNKLWRRHLLGLTIQTVVALYVFVRFWTPTFLSYLCIPLLVGGIIRYAERNIALFYSNRFFPMNKFKIKLMMNISESAHGILLREVKERCKVPEVRKGRRQIFMVSYAVMHFLFFINPLISDVSIKVNRNLLSMPSEDVEDTFKLVGTQLRIWHDITYTKKFLLDNTLFFVFRCISLVYAVFFLIASSIHFIHTSYYVSDVTLTCALLVGSIILDFWSVIEFFLSAWALTLYVLPCPGLEEARRGGVGAKLVKVCRVVFSKLATTTDKGGIRLMEQHSLIDYSINPKFGPFWARYNWVKVDSDLKILIYSHLQKKRKEYEEAKFEKTALSNFLEERGQGVLARRGMWNEFQWSVSEVAFTQSLLIWHVATHLVFYEDMSYYHDGGHQGRKSKLLSDYMMYLLVVRPKMLPADGLRELKIEHTRQHVKYCKETARKWVQFDFENERHKQACKSMRMSVLRKGHDLKKQLQELKNKIIIDERRIDNAEKWEIIESVWMEMLCFAASHCDQVRNANELRHGGELLTHVAFLLTHLGLHKRIIINTGENQDECLFFCE